MHQPNYNTAGEAPSTTCQSLRVPVALFERVTDKTPQESVVEWTRLVGMLTQHDVRTGKDGRLWSPVAYGENKARAARNVAEVSCLVLDFDDGARPEELTPQWEEKGLEFVIHTTHSHKPDEPKWRAVFPLAAPVPAGEWKDTYRKLTAHLAGGHADRSCKDVSRMYYLPSCKPGAEAFAEHNKGRPLNPDEVPEPAEKGDRRSVVLPAKIRKGERNPTLFSWACALRREGLSEEEILARLIKENEERCEEPLPLDEVRGIAHRAAQYPAGEAGQGRVGGRPKSVSTVLVELAEAAGVEFWHTPEGAQYASVKVGEHTEHWPLKSSAFREWLQNRLYQEEGRTAKRGAVDDALGVLGHRARSGPEHPIFTRVGEAEGAIYLDLADDEWRAVKVTPAGWEVVTDPPVRFRRSVGQLPLPAPESGGSLDDLRRFVNVSEDDWPLLAAWLLFAFRPPDDEHGDFPVLLLCGTQGSAKSTTSSVLKRLIDPHKAELRGVIRSDRDLAVAAHHSWVFALDNVSVIQEWLSDALCRLATGSSFSTRALYTDDEEVVFSAKRPIVVNGIGDFATRPDLLDRALLITCPQIPKEARKPDKEFWPAFNRALPRLLGAVLDFVCKALAAAPAVELAGNPRMADFATFATAAARAGAYDEEAFWAAYGENQENAHVIALEASPVAQAVLALLDAAGGGVWQGTATELLHALADHVEPETRRSPAWPKKADWLSKELDRLSDNLRAAGVTVTRERRGRAGQRVLVLTRSADANADATDANGPAADANADAKNGPQSKAARGFSRNADATDAKMRTLNLRYTVAPGEKKEREPAGEEREPPEEKSMQNGVSGVSGVSDDAAPNGDGEPAVTQDPVDDEEIGTCACGRPADRYTPVGEPICSACVEAASARQEEAPTADGKAGPGDAKFAGESEVVL